MTPTNSPQRKVSTRFLRIVLSDWPVITTGAKTEFRNFGRHAPHPRALVTPGPIICWTSAPMQEQRTALMVLEAAWSEPLGAISEASLEREGYRTLPEFRRYWLDRHKGLLAAYRPLSLVHVYRLRPWVRGEDEHRMGEALLDHLYGPWVSGELADA